VTLPRADPERPPKRLPAIPQRSIRTQKEADAPGSVPQHADDGHSVAYQKRSEKGQPGGYPELDGAGLVPPGQLGGGGADATKFLRGDQSWQVPAGGGDVHAIHDNVAGEIAAVTEKVTPVSADLLLIEDSAAGDVKKRVQVGNLPGGGAPTTADYLVGTAQGGLSAEIVVGTTPGGELGGTWAAPTVDATHSGSAHHASASASDGKHTVASQVISGVTATATQEGHVELATIAETDTGTDATRAVTPDGLAGSNYGERSIGILVSDPNGDAITVGDGKAYARIPSTMNGWNLIEVGASLSTVSSSGIPTVQVRRSRRASATTRTNADMLSTKLTIDASEFDSEDAAAAAVIDTANDDVNTGDHIYIDIDVAGTGAKGLFVVLTFRLP